MAARLFLYLLSGMLSVILLIWAPLADSRTAPAPHAAHLTIDGPIGPATSDYLSRTMEKAQDNDARLIILELDTPGGLLSTTRDIVRTILDSEIPVVVYVSPQGARAASAGTFILYASHVAAMHSSAHVGAATPVQMQGDNIGDGDEDSSSTAMERKVTNDAIAYLRNLAERHGRNADWAEEAIRNASTLTAREALEQNVIEIVSNSLADLLAQIDGREVVMSDGTLIIASSDLSIQTYEQDWRNRILSVLTNPQLAYLLLLVGIYGIIFELASPGSLFPGITGAICLLLAAFSLQILPINIVGILLIGLGAILLVMEMFIPSFSIIGVGGVIALMAGSLLLFDGSVPGMELSMSLIAAVGLVALASTLFISLVMVRSAWRSKKPSDRNVVGEEGKVVENLAPEGFIRLGNEIWPACARSPRQITFGKPVRVVAQEGTLAYVEEIKKTEQRPARSSIHSRLN